MCPSFVRQVVLLGCLVGVARPLVTGPININLQVDRALQEYKRKCLATGETSMALMDFNVDVVSGKGVTVRDLSTIKRVGDAFLWKEGTTHRFQMKVGWDVLREEVKELNFGGETMRAWFDMKDNAMNWEFTMEIAPGTCTSTWDKYQWIEMNRVTMHSDNPKYEGLDVSHIFKHMVMPYVNNMQNTPEFKEYLNKEMDYCQYVRKFI